MLKNKKKKSNKFTNLLKLINEFEDWKKQNNVESVFIEMEKRYDEIKDKQDEILKELRELNSKIT